MKTLYRVTENEDDEDVRKVIRAVYRLIGKESIPDVNAHGIDGGFNGFIYYADTVKFWRSNRTGIMTMLERDASDFGTTVIELVRGFGCLSDHGKPDYSEDEIGRALYGRYDDDLDYIYNALAWYAAETVCRLFED